MIRRDYRDFCRLQDRLEQGEALGDGEWARYLELSRTLAPARRELELLQGLAQLEISLPGEDCAIAAGALALLQEEEKVIPLRPGVQTLPRAVAPERASPTRRTLGRGPWRRPEAWPVAVAVALSSAAAAGFWIGQDLLPASEPAATGPSPSTASPSTAPPSTAPPSTAPPSTASPSTASLPLPSPSELLSPPPRTLPATPCELTFASGEVRVAGRPAAAGAAVLGTETEVEVGEGSACLSLPRGVGVCLGAHTRALLADSQGQRPRVVVHEGQVAATLTPRPPNQRFAMVVGHTVAEAVGTTFAVEKRTDDRISVLVLEGHVRVQQATTGEAAGPLTAPVLLGPAERLSLSLSLSLSEARADRDSVSRADLSQVQALLAPTRFTASSEVGIVHVTTKPAHALVTLDGVSLGPSPLSLLVKPGWHVAALFDEPEQPKEFAVGLGRTSEVVLEATGSNSPSPRAGTPEFPPGAPERAAPLTSRQLLEQARAQMRAGNASAAAGLYRRLRQDFPSSPESHTVLIALGQIELDHLGQPQRALQSFETYLTRGGTLTQEAELGRIRCLRALGERSREEQAIVSYLRRHPRSFHANTLEQRLRTLAP